MAAMVTGDEAVTWQQRLCPHPADAVLTAGKENITHCPSVRKKGNENKDNSKELVLLSGLLCFPA